MLKYRISSLSDRHSAEDGVSWHLKQFRKIPWSNHLLLLIFLITLSACTGQSGEEAQRDINPAAEGFNMEASDPEAIRLADSVMEAMGGRKAWDDMRFVAWNFFGARDLLWDKQTGRVRIAFNQQDRIYLVDVDDLTGRAWEDGMEITHPDSLKDRMTMARNIWINDSYWLFMPFKLKDSGVTLEYAGTDTMMTGMPAEVLQLTFENVGVTPDNMYKVYINPEDHLIYQWAYYRDAAQDSASAVWPWDNYQRHGDLLISADRSDGRGPKNVRIYEHVDDKAFTSFEDPGLTP